MWKRLPWEALLSLKEQWYLIHTKQHQQHKRFPASFHRFQLKHKITSHNSVWISIHKDSKNKISQPTKTKSDCFTRRNKLSGWKTIPSVSWKKLDRYMILSVGVLRSLQQHPNYAALDAQILLKPAVRYRNTSKSALQTIAKRECTAAPLFRCSTLDLPPSEICELFSQNFYP